MAETQRTEKAAAGEQSLSAMLAPCPPIPEGDLGYWTKYMHQRNLIGLIDALETARAFWRKCPQMVEANSIDWITPEMWEAFLQEYSNAGYEDHQLCEGFQGADLFDSDYPARVREEVERQLAYNATRTKSAT